MQFDYIGEPVTSIEEFQKQLTHLDNNGLVKKKILEEGGGLPVDKKFTVSFAYSGFWQNSNEPFDSAKISKPLVRYVSTLTLYKKNISLLLFY